MGPVIPFNLNQFELLHYKTYFSNVETRESIISLKWVNIHGTQYTKESIVVTNNDSSSPVFGKICSIYMIGEVVHFSVVSLPSILFDEHFHAYQVKITNDNFLMSVITYNDPPHKMPCLLVQKETKLFIATRYIL